MPVTQPETAQYIKDTLDSRSDWTFTKDNVRRMRGTVAKVEHSATWSWVDPATKGDFVQCIADFLAKDKDRDDQLTASTTTEISSSAPPTEHIKLKCVSATKEFVASV